MDENSNNAFTATYMCLGYLVATKLIKSYLWVKEVLLVWTTVL
jgi:hypothetical protein